MKLQGVLDAPVELSIAQASMACVPETPQESNTILTADVVESLLPHQPNFTGILLQRRKPDEDATSLIHVK